MDGYRLPVCQFSRLSTPVSPLPDAVIIDTVGAEDDIRKSQTLDGILAAVEHLAAEDNLACVLVHFNDTYFIDERPPDIPGMARIAGLTQTIRDKVAGLTGQDRVLVLHSGDYLSPSAMSQKFHGKPMVDLLQRCGLNFATLGNHEFDFQRVDPDLVWTRVGELAPCTHVLANLEAPSGHALPGLVFWPDENPFLAITGLAGEQTIQKALQAGFRRTGKTRRQTAIDLIKAVRARPGICAFVVLSHMDRDEDKELQKTLSELWGDHGFLYILGGHDHDIDWAEQDRWYAYLSKCKSNCKSVTVVLLPKDGLGAPFLEVRGSLTLPLTYEQEINLLRGAREAPADLVQFVAAHRRNNPEASVGQQDGLPPYTRAELLAAVLHFYRAKSGAKVRPDFQAAFERHIHGVFESWSDAMLDESIYVGEIVRDIVSLAASQALPGFANSIQQISSPGHLFALPVQPEAAALVEEWIRKMASSEGPNKTVIDFGTQRIAPSEMDATDSSLRQRSTDFGNFVADAIKRATGADVVLINSGAFRIDSRVSSKVTLNRLRDVFIYDRPKAITLLEMTVDELLAFYDHAISKGGHGAFLQVSESRTAAAGRTGMVQVAMVTHMLDDAEDGYRGILASARGITPEQLDDALGARAIDEKMTDLIAAGADLGVQYAPEERLGAASDTSPLERVIRGFAGQANRYWQACRGAEINEEDAINLLASREEQIPRERIERWNPDTLQAVEVSANELREFVRQVYLDHERPEELRERFFEKFFVELAHSRLTFEADVPYQRYLNAIADFFFDRC